MTENERGALEDSKHVRPKECICNPFDLAALGHMLNCPCFILKGDEYQFTEKPGNVEGFVLLRWTKNGVSDPLYFWQVPPEVGVEKAKGRVRTGELD